MKRAIHTIVGVAIFVFFAWFFHQFIIGQARRDFISNMFDWSPPAATASKNKPICSQIAVPAGTDCIPQHLANLPPDPGPAGMLTIEGVDSDKDGVRDDVQRRIVQKWGDSERAVRALFLVAKHVQQKVKYGGDISKEQAVEMSKKTGPLMQCYVYSVPEEIQQDQARERVSAMVTNTPERFERYRKFDSLLHMELFEMEFRTPEEACGYNPETLNN